MKSILNREYDEGRQLILNEQANLVQEMVSFGISLFGWYNESLPGNRYSDAPIMFLIRQMLETLDGTSILIRQSSIEPAKPVLRSLIENYLAIKYICETNSENRALAYLIVAVHDKIKIYDRLDPETSAGQKYYSAISDDVLFSETTPPAVDFKAARKNLQKMLQRSEFEAVEAEYQRKAKTRTSPSWYSLFSDPSISNIEQLAQHLNLSVLYQVHYRVLSGEAHAIDSLSHARGRSENDVSCDDLRYPGYLQGLMTVCYAIALDTFEKLINIYVPDRMDCFTNWKAELHGKFESIRTGFDFKFQP